MQLIHFIYVLIVSSVLLTQTTHAAVQLPLTTVRDQSDTAHCWAYSASHFLESRSLVRDSQEVLINVEKDVKYWVDYERMMYNFRYKQDFYLGSYEGGWQIEFLETLFKHGKNLIRNQGVTPSITYKPLEDFFAGLPFMEEPRPVPNYTMIPLEQVTQKMHGFTDETQAHEFAIDYLNRLYGAPSTTTVWDGQEIDLKESSQFILGSDFQKKNSVEAFVLVKPVYDGGYGWIKYLNDRYWGYRYDQNKILELVELSLTNQWPVTFDNVYHAMTIIGFTQAQDGQKFYAVADSAGGKITWYDESRMIADLNLVTFAKEAIQGALPERAQRTLLRMSLPQGKTIDQVDNVTFPPR